MELIKLLAEQGLSPADAAKILGVHTPQIYKWNKDGISPNSKYYHMLERLIEIELITKPHTKTKTGLPDRRVNSGRHKAQLTLTEANLPITTSQRERDSIFPKIIFKKT